MPRYHLAYGQNYEDPAGSYFADHDAALAQARRVLSELNRNDFDGAGLTMAVQDALGHTLYPIPF